MSRPPRSPCWAPPRPQDTTDGLSVSTWQFAPARLLRVWRRPYALFPLRPLLRATVILTAARLCVCRHFLPFLYKNDSFTFVAEANFMGRIFTRAWEFGSSRGLAAVVHEPR